MKPRKYSYYKIIQQNYGYGRGFEDVDAHECNSSGFMTSQQRATFRENLKAYRENSPYHTRVIFRRELSV